MGGVTRGQVGGHVAQLRRFRHRLETAEQLTATVRGKGDARSGAQRGGRPASTDGVPRAREGCAARHAHKYKLKAVPCEARVQRLRSRPSGQEVCVQLRVRLTDFLEHGTPVRENGQQRECEMRSREGGERRSVMLKKWSVSRDAAVG